MHARHVSTCAVPEETLINTGGALGGQARSSGFHSLKSKLMAKPSMLAPLMLGAPGDETHTANSAAMQVPQTTRGAL